jgi:hypothetical protein
VVQCRLSAKAVCLCDFWNSRISVFGGEESLWQSEETSAGWPAQAAVRQQKQDMSLRENEKGYVRRNGGKYVAAHETRKVGVAFAGRIHP